MGLKTSIKPSTRRVNTMTESRPVTKIASLSVQGIPARLPVFAAECQALKVVPVTQTPGTRIFRGWGGVPSSFRLRAEMIKSTAAAPTAA